MDGWMDGWWLATVLTCLCSAFLLDAVVVVWMSFSFFFPPFSPPRSQVRPLTLIFEPSFSYPMLLLAHVLLFIELFMFPD
ncbi:hypothetical protein QR685DRAFT_102033 [Neurospora intermedia]|uniref:Secreted peptide n=1 Tax=Neurospora intermedia TaxID=5142 RepID=A0ABR3D1P6_NEUIN